MDNQLAYNELKRYYLMTERDLIKLAQSIKVMSESSKLQLQSVNFSNGDIHCTPIYCEGTIAEYKFYFKCESHSEWKLIIINSSQLSYP